MSKSKTENTRNLPEKPGFSPGISPWVLTGDKLMLVPMTMDHCHDLHAAMFGKAEVMKYAGPGKAYTMDEYMPIHEHRLNGNLLSKYNKNTGRLSLFSWTIITHEGMAGQFNIFKKKEKTELAFAIFPSQQGRGLARRASELVIEYLARETPLIATAHPANIASAKTLESIHYPDGKFAFFRDPKRQKVPNVYGPNQPRDYFISQKSAPLKFFSFYKGKMQIIDPEKAGHSENSEGAQINSI